jgi:hypothetical protein
VFDTALDAVADVVAGHSDVVRITARAPCRARGQPASRHRHFSPTRLPGPYAAAPTWIEQSVDCVVGRGAARSGPPELGAAEDRVSGKRCSRRHPKQEWSLISSVISGPRCISTAPSCSNISSRERAEMKTFSASSGCCPVAAYTDPYMDLKAAGPQERP